MSRWVRKVEIVYTPLSDHHPNKCDLAFVNYPKRALRWKFNLTLLQDANFCEHLKELNGFISINKNSVSDVRYLWDAIKGSIRNFTISFASARNQTYLQELVKMKSRFASLTFQQQNKHDQEREKELRVVKAELNAFLMRRAEFLVHRARETQYLNGTRPSFVLLRKIHCNDKKADIVPIQNREGEVIYDTLEINHEFKLFYQQLYSSEVTFSKNYIVSFFDGLNVPKLSEQQKHLLDFPLTIN